MPIVTGNDFVAALAEFQLLNPDQLYKVQRAQQSQPADSRTIAAHLLKQGWLTPHQAEMLLDGRGAELVAPRPAALAPLPPPAVRTVLVPRQPRQSISPPPSRRALWLALAGSGVLLAALTVMVVLYATKGSGDGRANGDKDTNGSGKDQATDPEVVIDEDFRGALLKGLNVPEGWQGDDLRVVKASDEPCLEASKQDGVAFATLPKANLAGEKVNLAGDFFIVAAYSLPPNHELTVRLEKRETNSLLKIAIQPSGFVRIGGDTMSKPPNYKPYLPVKLVLTRKGRQLKLSLNNETVCAKDLGEITEYETLKVGLTGESSYHARLFRLKVGVPGSDGSVPNVPLPELPGKK